MFLIRLMIIVYEKKILCGLYLLNFVLIEIGLIYIVVIVKF